MSTGVSYLRDESIREQTRRELLTGERLELDKTIHLLHSLASQLDELKSENAHLREENKAFRAQRQEATWGGDGRGDDEQEL